MVDPYFDPYQVNTGILHNHKFFNYFNCYLSPDTIKAMTAGTADSHGFYSKIELGELLYASIKLRCPVLIPRIFYSHDLAASLGGFLGVDAGNSHGKSLFQRNGGFFFIQ